MLRAVLYASLFDYPLTLEQLRDTVGVPVEPPVLAAWLRRGPLLRAAVETDRGLVFPAGRRDLVAIRDRREAASRRRLAGDTPILRFVAGLPFVRMAAISGSLAHLNAEDDADLDLFVIAAPGRVWSVTVATLVAAKLFGWRRRLCLNYVISERALAVHPPDLFSANQIVHLQPQSGATVYAAFLRANPFVAACYPNFRGRVPAVASPPRLARWLEPALAPVAPLAERVCRTLYARHLRRRAATWRSRDQVRLERECLKLHTSSHRAEVMARFEAALADALLRADEAMQPSRTGTS